MDGPLSRRRDHDAGWAARRLRGLACLVTAIPGLSGTLNYFIFDSARNLERAAGMATSHLRVRTFTIDTALVRD